MHSPGKEPVSGRLSNKVIAAEVRRKREVIWAYMAEQVLNQNSLSKLTGFSRASISRALHDDPPTHTPCLRKLYAFVTTSRNGDLEAALPVIEAFSQDMSRFDGATAAQILRAVADLLDRRNAAKP
ncbi:hypothetical protein ISN76_19425 [Dyella halodurans]|uniref:XRE family transcriptional regulator n=1 Tax=Dyella halodurans TaxID=1920171 RepID=A0ABV9C031_9GAMM|nr:hypothetical protein [Dyella halodurans]